MTRRGIAITAAAALAAAAVPFGWRAGAGIYASAAHAEECNCGGGRHGGGGHGRGSAGGAVGGAGGSSSGQHTGGVHPGADQVPGGVTSHEVDTGEGAEAGHGEGGGHPGGKGGPAVTAGAHGSGQRASGYDRASQHAKVEGAGRAGGHAAGGPGRGTPGGGIWGTDASHADVPHVEIGRLNVAHAPSRVFDRAAGEALAGLDPDTRAIYALPFDQALAELAKLPEDARVEGPLQNLALYRALMEGRSLPLQPGDRLAAAALFLGSAAGAEAAVDRDTVLAVNALLGLGRMDEATIDGLATRAERVRQTLSAGHEAHTEGAEEGHGGGRPGGSSDSPGGSPGTHAP